MKRTLYILFTIFIFGCNNQEKQEIDPRVEKFESFLGKEESKALNELVKTFELFLKNNFENSRIEESYKEYVIRMYNNELESWSTDSIIQDNILELIKQSGLRYEIYLLPIEVWNDKRRINMKYQYIDNKDTVDQNPSIGIHKSWSDKKVDSIINKMKKTSIEFNMNGRYMRGLDLIKNQDSTIIYYLQDKFYMGGGPAAPIVAVNLNARNPDYSDYFIKRIIVIELYYIEIIRQLTSPNSI